MAGLINPLNAVSTAASAAGRLTGLRRRRQVWQRPGRLHIETHGVHGSGGGRVGRRVERALAQHPGVRWARVNAPACRVVVELADPPPATGELVALVAQAESAPASDEEEIAEAELHHPADGVRRGGLVPKLAVDGAALLLAGVNRVAPWAPLPAEVAGLVSATGLHPRLRELAAARLHGPQRAESVLSMTAGVAQALAARSSGVVLDIAQRVSEWREAGADERVWRRLEPQLIDRPEHAGAEPVARARPRRLPDGPAERYQRRALAAGAAAAGAAWPVLGPRRAVAVGLAALPKATETGRAAFAAELGVVLARQGGLVMDRTALRLLDRLDTLVLDGELLRWGRWTLTDLVPLGDTDPSEAAEQGFGLFAPDQPAAVRTRGEWTLGPAEELELTGEDGAKQRERLRHDGAELVLGLARDRRLVAVLAAQPQPAPGYRALAQAGREAGLQVVTGEPDAEDLAEQVRRIQYAGGAALVVSGDRRALAAADCGVGVHQAGTPPPWGAHVLAGAELALAELVVHAAAAARRVDRDAIRLAQVATGVGVTSVVAGSRRGPAARSLGAVGAGAALAFVDGHWRARRLPAAAPPDSAVHAPWHLMPASAVLARLDTGADGLTSAQVRERAGRAGQPARPLGTSLAAAFWEELANPLTPVLAGGAAISAVVGSLADAGLVAGITGVSALAGAAQRVRTDRALAELFARASVTATVRRDGEERQSTAEQLVPGDLVQLAAGDVVPADCRLLEADAAEADESSLTGESLPVAKDPAPVVAGELAERRSMLYEGTTLASGRAVAVVVATGADTEVGRSMAAAAQARPATGLQSQLGQLTRSSLPLAGAAAAAVTGAGLLRGVPAAEGLSAAVSLAVASVPEGLPFLANGAQLAAARRLAARGTLVRNPHVVEALGRVDVLCFDKTGTLTGGRLSVQQVDDGGGGHEPASLPQRHRQVLAAALRASPDGEHPEQLTHQTDRAVVECARDADVPVSTGATGWRRLGTLAFDPSRGFHATLGRCAQGPLLSVKGGAEVVLSRCGYRRADGRDEPMTEPDLADLEARAESLAAAGHRVLAVAERRPPGSPAETDLAEAPDEAVQDLVFVGFLALADPVRPSAAPAVARLRQAGVRTVMITGDHPATAEAIAAAVTPEGEPVRVVAGADLAALDDDALDRRLDEVDVIARCSPTQKVRIIEAYRRLGKVVAMTGDGANDAPAIRLADVGIALGRRGTPAAQAAADLVVSDDRLETIIAALVEGRAMWASVRRALAILVGGNFGEIAFTVLGAALTGRSPLNARQLLLVNLLTDLAPALAIALRPPAGHEPADLLRAGPDRAATGGLGGDLAARAGTTLAGASVAWLAARLTGRSRRASTVALAALVGTQLGQTLLTGGTDRNVLLAGVGSAAVLAGLIQTPGVSHFFGCTPLGPVGWGIAAGSATAATLAGELVRVSASRHSTSGISSTPAATA